MEKRYSDITPYIHELADMSNSNHLIEPAMYEKHHVQRGLRDINGNGVVAGLTEISCIKAKETLPDGTKVPCDGQLFYRGVNVRDLVNGFMKDGRYGFEEAAYLLLMGELPSQERLTAFSHALGEYRSLPSSFVRDMILKAPGRDMMNIISRCVLALYTYDDQPDDISVPNVLRQIDRTHHRTEKEHRYHLEFNATPAFVKNILYSMRIPAQNAVCERLFEPREFLKNSNHF